MESHTGSTECDGNCASAEALRAENANLELALLHRDIIGQAKGILMASQKLTSDGAFAALVGVSQQLHTKLYTVALLVVESGEIARPVSRARADRR